MYCAAIFPVGLPFSPPLGYTRPIVKRPSYRMNFSVGAKTDPGRRANNEDYLVLVHGKERNLTVDAILIVADGMGGRNFGERASETAGTVAADTLSEMLAAPKGRQIPVQDAIGSALRKANAAVYELSQSGKDHEGMGTTCVVAVITEDRLFVGHAGDSRAYMIRGGVIERITNDHSFVGEQVRAGTITEEHARKSKFRNVITRAVGIEPTIEPDIVEFPLSDVQAVLLCTDGLSGELRDEDLERLLVRASTAQGATDSLVDLANKRGGRDNITALVAKFGDGPIRKFEGNPDEDEEEEEEFFQPERRQRSERKPAAKQGSSNVMPWLVAATVIFGAATFYLAQFLSAAGFVFQLSPPFFDKPKPPPPPPPPDYASLKYDKPEVVPNMPPLRDEPIMLNAKTHDIIVETLDGDGITIAPDGGKKASVPLPNLAYAFTADAPGRKAGFKFSVDPGGNLYMLDTADRSIMMIDTTGKRRWVYAPDKKYVLPKKGQPIQVPGKLTGPTDLAVDDDGSVYVIDSGRLKVLRPLSSKP